MTLLGFIVLLVIAAIAGTLGQAIAGYSVGGCLMSIVVGFVGAFLGLWIARQLGLPEWLTIQIQGESFPLVWSIIGSALLSAVLGLLLRRRPVV
ncbi:MAG: GlsB/YeaQ/YmgE family stress response membrane protein [Anaerolineaceae bacterium]|jgi:uncharacterized membrane protein YeaQ/YmgE (transglycosylase-associated protein family)|nr:GlsB/YeaQ/YmgE family stress response membrane protein [Anaerolineaceae bacterium]